MKRKRIGLQDIAMDGKAGNEWVEGPCLSEG